MIRGHGTNAADGSPMRGFERRDRTGIEAPNSTCGARTIGSRILRMPVRPVAVRSLHDACPRFGHGGSGTITHTPYLDLPRHQSTNAQLTPR